MGTPFDTASDDLIRSRTLWQTRAIPDPAPPVAEGWVVEGLYWAPRPGGHSQPRPDDEWTLENGHDPWDVAFGAGQSF